VQHGGDQPQHVHRREHHRGRAHDRVAPAGAEDTGQDRELPGEGRRPRHRERDHARGHQHRRQSRSASGHPAQRAELTGRRAPLDRACEEEERRGDETVVDHLEHRPVQAEVVDREEAERDQAHLREARVGDHAAQVGRAEGDERAVDEAAGGEHEDRRAQVCGRPGELRDRDAQETVGGDLGDDPAQHRRDLGRGLAVRVRQPRVQREERRLHREGRHEAQEDPGAAVGAAVDEVEGPLRDPKHDDRGEHQQRARHRVDHEQERCPQPPRPSPHADEEVERDEHRLPEDVEEQQVLGDEDAGDRARQQQHQPVVGARALTPDPDGVADSGGEHDDGHPDEPHREPVEADVVGDVEVAEPALLLRQLQPALAEVEARGGIDPQRDLGEG
jgi:hypothetical protein